LFDTKSIPAIGKLGSAVGDFSDRLFDRSIRLAVTGLSQGGKTVFISSLINQLLRGQNLPFFSVISDNRFIGARLDKRPDQEHESFPYKRFIDSIYNSKPAWPEPTDRIREIRVAIRYRPVGFLRKRLSTMSTLNLDIVDYPGEWLLDLPLLGMSYQQWSAQTLELCQNKPRDTLAKDWLNYLASLEHKNNVSEQEIAQAATLYSTFLQRCRDPQYHLSFLQPGRFIMPGELKNSPLLHFCPYALNSVHNTAQINVKLFTEMETRFETYKQEVVKKFYDEQFSHFDRQIVLADLLKTLNTSYETFLDMQQSLTGVLQSFHYGRSSLFQRLFDNRIDKVLFAATKADHVASNQHHNLKILFERMVMDAARNIGFQGVQYEITSLSSIKCTETVVTDYHGQKLSCVKGKPKGADQEKILFPGEIPEYLPTPEDWNNDRFNFQEFLPPVLPDLERNSMPHIRLDQALEFLIGDKMQ